MVSSRQARAAAVSVLVAAQHQRVWGYAGVRALPHITQRQHSNQVVRLQACDDHEEQRLGLSRAELLRQIRPGFFGALVVGAAAKTSSAALPTTEDYAFGTGSKVNRRPSEDKTSVPLAASSVNPNNLLEVVEAISAELDGVESLVQKERWGDALTRIKSFPLVTLKSPTLGLGSVDDVALTLGVSKSQASEILEASMEAGLTLREVEDTVFSNTRTLEFFNSADLKQVEALAKNATPTDLTEPLGLLSDTRQLVNGVKDMMVGKQ